MAKRSGAPEVRTIGVMRRDRRSLLLTTALQASALLVIAAPALAQAPNARPTGGVVSAGTAQISQSTSNTLVSQQSQRAVVDWKTFNVGSQQSVTFAQPSSSAITLNRVDAAHPSQIAGRISANGQLVIENRSGVFFANGAEVTAQSLVVTAAGITNSNFMAGRMVFDIASKPDARIVNQGHITVQETGLAALVAPSVANSGVITAKMGHVVLAGATTHTVDLYGDGLLAVDVTGSVKQAPIGRDGKPVNVLVTNTGTIVADGGTVVLTARAADGIVSNLVEAGGHIHANSVGDQTGSVRIAGIGGSIVIDGVVTASGRDSGTKGGAVELTATDTVKLTSKAVVSASGRTGGGTVAIGTDLARARGGAGVTPGIVASKAIIAAGAKISADATEHGDGGRVTVLSTTQTSMAGKITARGGRRDGDGGTVEVSGETGFGLTGTVDVSAPHGLAGSILLDPTDLTIANGGTDTVTNNGTDGSTLAGGTAATIDPTAFENLTGNVTLQASNDLTVNSTFTAAAATLILDAGHNLTVNAQIGLTGAGTITLVAADTSFSGATGYAANGPAGVLSIATGGVNAAGGSLVLNSGTAGITISAPITVAGLTVTTPGLLTVSSAVAATTAGVSAGSIEVGATGKLTGTTVTATTTVGANAGTTIDIAGSLGATGILSLTAGTAISEAGILSAGTLTGGAASAAFTGTNSVTSLGSFTTTGNFSLTNGGTLAVTGPVTAGAQPVASTNMATLALTTTAGDINVTGSVASGTVSLAAAGNIVQTAGTVVANTLTGSAGTGSATFNSHDTIAALGNFVVGGSLALTNTNSLTVSGIVTAGTQPVSGTNTGSITLVTSAGDLTISGQLAAGSLSLTGAANVVQTAGTLVANTLTGGAGTGSATFTGSDTIGTLGSFASGVNFTLTDAVALAVAGTVTAGAQPVSTANTAVIALTTSVGDLTLTSGTLAAGTVSLNAAGNIAQTGLAVNAQTLTVPGAVNVNLTNASNTIVTLGAVTATGTLAVQDAVGLTVGNALSLTGAGQTVALTAAGSLQVTNAITADGFIALTASGANAISVLAPLGSANGSIYLSASTITIGPIALSGAPAVTLGAPTQTISIVADTLTRARDTTDTITAATVELAPRTAGTAVTLGTGLGYAVDTAGITATTLRIGAASTVGNATPTTTASTLTVSALSGFSASGFATLDLRGTGTISQLGTLSNVTTLTGSASSVVLGGLFSAGVGTLAGFTTTAGDFSLTDTGALAVLGTVTANGGAGNISLNVTGPLSLGSAGTGGIAAALNGGTVTLQASGATGTITEPNGTITATQLVIPTAASVGLGGANLISQVGSVISTGSIALTDGTSLSVLGTMSAAAGSLVINVTSGGIAIVGQAAAGLNPAVVGALNAGTVSLSATTLISEPSGTITASVLTIPTAGTVALGGANAVTTLQTGTATAGFALTDAGPLTVLGTITAGSTSLLSLNVTAGALTLGATATPAALNAGTVSLSSFGAITETNGTISATTLMVPTATSVTLAAANLFSQLGTVGSSGNVTVTDGQAVTVVGAVGAGAATGTGTLTLNVTGALAIGAPGTLGSLTGGTIALLATGAITEPNGTVSATLLTGPNPAASVTSSPGITLTAAGNSIADLGPLASTGDVRVTDGTALLLLGTITAGSTGTLALTANGALTIGQTGTAVLLSAGTVALVASGAITEPVGSITANVLSGPQTGAAFTTASSVNLNGTNTVGVLNGFASSGAFNFQDTQGLTVLGTVAAGNAATLQLTTAGSLAIGQIGTAAAAGALNGGTVSLAVTGNITEPNGTITASALTGTSTGLTFVSLPGANAVTTVGGFTTTGGFQLVDTVALTVPGTIQVGGAQTLALSAPSLTVSGELIAPTFANAGATTVVSPGSVLIQADNFSLPGIIFSPGGLVAIAPQTNGRAISVDAATNTLDLSLLATDLARIDTIHTAPGGSSVFLFGSTQPGPTGTQTLLLGSIDGVTALAGSITFTTSLSLQGSANTLALVTGGTISQTGSLSVQTLTGSAAGVTLGGANNVTYLGNVANRNGFTATTTLPGSFVSSLDLRLTDASALYVVGLGQAGAGHVLALTAPSITVDARQNPTDTLASPDNNATNAGSLAVSTASLVAAGITTVTPGAIQLAANALQLLSTNATDILVQAPAGSVAIAPQTAGTTISVDATRTTAAGNLSLTPTDLGHIDTVNIAGAGTPALVANTLTAGPAGTQTLILGSLDGLNLVAGGISINTPIAFGTLSSSGGVPVITAGSVGTLALYSKGTIAETGTGAVTVNRLVAYAGIAPGAAAAAGPGSITLGGANLIGGLGDASSSAGLTSTAPVRFVAASGNILLADGVDVTVTAGATLQAGANPGTGPVLPAATLEIDTAAAAGVASASINIAGTAQAGFDSAGTVSVPGSVILRAATGATAGTLSVTGLVYAEPGTGGGTAILTAGYDTTGTTRNTACAAGTCAITIAGTVTGNATTAATSVTLLAAGQIVESGAIVAASLHGASGFAADLRGGSFGANRITTLAGFDSNLAGTAATVTGGYGFVLRDGAALAVSSAVIDHGGSGLAIEIAGASNAAADLTLSAALTTGTAATILLEATGNVYEANAAAIITTGTLTGSAGVLPDLDGGVAPGTIPTLVAPLSAVASASGVFGNANTIGTLGAFSATNSVVLVNSASLSVAGNVLAGAGGNLATTTPPVTLPASVPSVNIAIASGALTIGSTIEAGYGFTGYPTGAVTVSAGNAVTPGSVSVLVGGAVGAQSGPVILIAGVTGDPTTAGATYATACGTCTISIAGAVGPQAGETTAGTVGLYASGGITGAGGVTAALLQGQAGVAPSGSGNGALANVALTGGNDIAAIGNFAVSGGFSLTDSAALTVSGTLAAATASTATTGVGTGTFDVVLSLSGQALAVTGAITDGVAASGTPAGGNITLTAGSLTDSGSIQVPGGANGGGKLTTTISGSASDTGTIIAATLTGGAASANFAGATTTTNQVTTLAGFVTAGNFLLDDGSALTVTGSVAAGTPAAPNVANTATLTLASAGALTIGTAGTPGTLNAGTVVLLSPAAITELPNSFINANLLTGPTTGATYISATSVSLTGTNSITTIGAITASGGVSVSDAASVTITGLVSGSNLTLTSGGALTIGTAANAGTLSATTVTLLAPGTISEANGFINAGTLTGPNAAASVPSTAGVMLGGANSIANLGAFTSTTGFALNDNVSVAVIGAVSAVGTLAITGSGGLAIGTAANAGSLSGATVAMDVAGDITEPNGSISATLLTGPTTGLTYATANSATLDSATNTVGTLGAFTTIGPFDLIDGTGLVVAGNVTAGNAASLGLTANGALTLAGTLTAGTVRLDAPGTISETTGAILAGTLLGPQAGMTYASATSANLGGANNIGTLSGFVSSGHQALTDTGSLLALGTISAGTADSLGITLTVGGNITLGNATTSALLTASTGPIGLLAPGTISEANGLITAGYLSGSAPGQAYSSAASVALNNSGNAISILGSFASTGDFNLVVNAQGLSILGSVSAGLANNLSLTSAGSLLLGGFGTQGRGILTAGTVTLLAPGSIGESTSLTAFGQIIAGTLIGPQAGQTYTTASSADLQAIPSIGNTIGTLSGFDTTGSFALNDSIGLTVVGPLLAGIVPAPNAANTASILLVSGGALTLGVASNGATINGGTVSLMAASGITQTGGSIAANQLNTLTSTPYSFGSNTSTTGAVSLTSTGNVIASLGTFNVRSGSLTLLDGTSLIVGGPVTASGMIQVTDHGLLTVNGMITAGTTVGLTADQAISIIGATVTGPGGVAMNAGNGAFAIDSISTITAANGNIGLADNGAFSTAGYVSAGGNVTVTDQGSATISGLVSGGNGVAITASQAITQVGGAISALGAGGVQLAANGGGFTQATGANISASGGGGLTITDQGSASLAGSITTANAITITSAQSVAQTAGKIIANGAGGIAIIASSGSITQSSGATISVGAPGAPIGLTAGNGIAFGGVIGGNAPSVSLIAGSGGITETVGGTDSGALTAGVLALSAGTSIALDSTANTVGTLGNVSAGGAFTLVDQSDLHLGGNVTAGSAIVVSSAGALSQDAGAIQSNGGNVSLTASSTLSQAANTSITTTAPAGTLRLTAPSGMALAGTLSATGSSATLALVSAGGPITEAPTGHVDATLLSLSVGGSANLGNTAGGGNLVTTLGSSTVSGLLTLADARDLTITGPVVGGGGVTLGDLGSLIFAGGAQVTGPAGPITLNANVNVVQNAGGLIGGTAVTITVPGSTTLGGTVSGNKIVVVGPGNTLAGPVLLTNGATLTTGSAGNFSTAQSFASLPTYLTGTAGAYFYTQSFTQQGLATVNNGGNQSTLRIDSEGDITFGAAPQGLFGPATTLIVDILGAGSTTGNINVKAFLVGYAAGSSTSADLTGSINDLSGQTAAQAGLITPTQNARFRFNSCPIGSVNCVVLPIAGIPPLNPTQDLDIGNFRDSEDDSDLLLPNVSDKDY